MEGKVYTLPVTKEGQITIPDELMRALGITDKVAMEVVGDKIILTKA